MLSSFLVERGKVPVGEQGTVVRGSRAPAPAPALLDIGGPVVSQACLQFLHP